MRGTSRTIAAIVVLTMVFALPLTVMADETRTRGEADQTTRDRGDAEVEPETQTVRDQSEVREVDDAVVDRSRSSTVTERPVERCHRLADNPRGCAEEPETNLRQLFWRLVNAQEWGKLLRLLHHLGWI